MKYEIRPISPQELWAKRSPAAKRAGVGAWKARQIKAWGLPYPPPKGWARIAVRLWHEQREERQEHQEHEDEIAALHAELDARFEALVRDEKQ
jgi:hypothetical protein